MRTKLESAYLRHYKSGKSAASRLLDRIILCAFAAAAAYHIALPITNNRMASFFLSAAAGIIVLLAADITFRLGFARSIREQRESAAKRVLRRKMLLASTDELLKEVSTAVKAREGYEPHVFQKVLPVSDEELFSLLRSCHTSQHIVLVSVSGFTQEAEALARTFHTPNLKLIDAEDITGLKAAYKPSEAEVDDEILAQPLIKGAKQTLSIRMFAECGRAVRYLAFGTVLYLLSLVSTSGVYLRVLASIVTTAAVIAAWYSAYHSKIVDG